MTTIKLIGFTGEIPRIQPRQLPEAGAQYAFNCRLEDGSLVPIRERRFVRDLTDLGLSQVQTIYLHDGEWLAWDAVVNAVPGPVATDRLYYTGDGAPKMRVDGDVYDLAVPYPTVALSGTPSGPGTGSTYTRIYVYTFVTEFGEESEPSAASAAVSWQSGQVVTLTGFQAAPAGRGITLQRIYRSQTSSSGDTQLYFIAERAASASDYVDSIAVNAFAEALPSANWNAPPATLKGLTAMPNGMMAAFDGKKLYFCEPYRPHAWPEAYVLTTNYNIVALAAYGTSLVVATEGTPYVAQGTAPENMQMERIETNLPCINARSMVDLGYAAAYASNDGLVVVSAGTARVVTDQLFTRLQWRQLGPSSMVAGQLGGRYFASYESLDEDGQPISGTLCLDLTGATPFLVRMDDTADAFFYQVETGSLYFLVDQSVYEFDSISQPAGDMVWRSKLFVTPNPENFGAMYIDGGRQLTPAEQAALEALLAALYAQNELIYAGSQIGVPQFIPFQPYYSGFNGSPYNAYAINGNSDEVWDDVTLPPSGSIGGELNGEAANVYAINGDPLNRAFIENNDLTVRIYADRALVAVINDLNQMIRLPSGFKARQWEIEVEGSSPVYEIAMANTAGELKAS